MDQGPKDQNSETRDFSPADEGDNHDNVNLMDMELEPQLEDEIPSAADLLAGTFNMSFGFGNEYQLPDLPVEEPHKCVEEFISSQLGESSPRSQEPSAL